MKKLHKSVKFFLDIIKKLLQIAGIARMSYNHDVFSYSSYNQL